MNSLGFICRCDVAFRGGACSGRSSFDVRRDACVRALPSDGEDLAGLVGLVAVYVVVLITRLRITKFGFPAQELGDPCLILKNLRHAPFEY